MNIFFLDDMQVRRDLFKEWSWGKQHNVCFACNYDEAVEVLPTKEWDLVFFDHDLCLADVLCKPGVDNIEKTGTDVAKFIIAAQNPNVSIKKAIVHTHNHYAALRMLDLLTQCKIPVVIDPFGPGLREYL